MAQPVRILGNLGRSVVQGFDSPLFNTEELIRLFEEKE
jgi:hypothetical protein